jgi:hypothetical protein
MRSSVLTALAIACHLSLPVPSVHAQQASRPGSTSPARRGYFSRVQTESGAASPATGGSPPRLRLDLTRSNVEAYRSEPDPMRTYTRDGRETTANRPYERPPVVSPPEVATPAPPVSHNYYPTLRAGQGPNRNVGPAGTHARCVPGRAAFLHR